LPLELLNMVECELEISLLRLGLIYRLLATSWQSRGGFVFWKNDASIFVAHDFCQIGCI
jgi:hypothetical protein